MNRLLACFGNFVEDAANQLIDYDDNDDDDDDDTERQMAPAELVNVTSPAPWTVQLRGQIHKNRRDSSDEVPRYANGGDHLPTFIT